MPRLSHLDDMPKYPEIWDLKLFCKITGLKKESAVNLMYTAVKRGRVTRIHRGGNGAFALYQRLALVAEPTAPCSLRMVRSVFELGA